jgi:RNA recognition motif-containing protein
VYVAGISRSVIAEDLREAFEKFGPIRDVFMKGKYAFIEYESPKDAAAAIEDMNGKDMRGHNICVEATSKFIYALIHFRAPW